MVPPASRRPPPPGPAFSERIRARDVRGTSVAVALAGVIHLVVLVVLLLAPQLTTPGTRRLYAPEWLIELARPVVGERFILLPRLADRAPSTGATAEPVVQIHDFFGPPPELAVPEPAEAPAPSGLVGGETPAPEPAAPAPSAGGGGGGGIGVPLTVAERLRPGEKDPRLWALLPEEIVGLSGEQRLQLEMALAIEAMGDSAAAVAAASRGFTDWTYTDEQGRRWGFSPGQLHLGDITIPLPFGFASPPNTLAARRTREDAEIASQAGRQEVRQSLRDRAAEIRRRRDAERARARGDTTGVADR